MLRHRRPERLRLLLAVPLAVACVAPAHAERIQNKVAVFSALDKVTARISKFEVELGKTVTFGPIKVTPRACYSRPATELPKTTTFVEVDETQLDGKVKRIFTGWMFAESPGIFGVEHPTIDVWLTECSKPVNQVAQKPPPPKAKEPEGDPGFDGEAGDAPDAGSGEASASQESAAPAEGEGEQAPVERRRVRR